MGEFKLKIEDEKYFELIYKQFGKTKVDVDEYVDILSKWAKSQPHFPEVPPTNPIRFAIAACKFSIERAKEKIDMYYTIRKLMPEIYCTHPLSSEMVFHSRVVYCVVLPKLPCNYHRVFYVQCNPDIGPEDFKFETYVAQLTHVIEVILQEDNCYNFECILNWDNMKMGHVSKFSPMVVKKLLVCLEKVYANRLAAVYLVNFPTFFENLMNTMVFPFMPAKLKSRGEIALGIITNLSKASDCLNRELLVKKLDMYGVRGKALKWLSSYLSNRIQLIQISKGIDVLHKAYDKSILPREVGGEERSAAELQEMMMKKIEEWKDRFDKIQYMTVDESLRPQKLENDDILGYYGSFKKINID